MDFVIGSPGNVMWYIGVMLFISLLLKLIIVFDKNIHKAMAVWFVISVLLFVFSVLWDESRSKNQMHKNAFWDDCSYICYSIRLG